MPIRLGSNIESLRAQRAMSAASSALLQSFERLSSGQRINRASDDAAGLSIAAALSSNTRVYTQAIRNINDGISTLNIAAGAVGELSNIITRMTELAEQSANGVYSYTQRLSLNDEALALTHEYNRIIESTTFNGIYLLDGSEVSRTIQQGFGTTETTALQMGRRIGHAAGDGSFGVTTTYALTGNAYYDITGGDFNNDGQTDLAVTFDTAAGYVDVFLGRSDGTFAPVVSFTAASFATGIEGADFNDDGQSDLVVSGADYFQIFLANQNGTFRAPTNYINTGGANGYVTVGDFNGDGNKDFAAVGTAQSFEVFLGTGSGSFSRAGSFFGATAQNRIESADFNGDGADDLVIANGNFVVVGTGNVLISNGDGTFKAPVSYLSGNMSVSTAPYAVATGDFDRDGSADFALTDGNGTQTISVFLNKGDGTFKPRMSYVGTSISGLEIDAADVNSDGALDLIATGGATFQTHVFINNGDGIFKNSVDYNAGTNTIYSGYIADFSGDGVLDYAAVGAYSSLNVLFGNSDATRRANKLDPVDLTSKSSSRAALRTLKNQLSKIADELGGLGAYQSRLEVSAAVLDVRRTTYQAAESAIMDSDVSKESSILVRNNILREVSSAILAQANTQSEIVLQLLR